MKAMQVRFNKISSADFRGKSSNKPWKLRLLLQEGEEDLIGVEVADNLAICREVTDLRIMIVMATKMGIITSEME